MYYRFGDASNCDRFIECLLQDLLVLEFQILKESESISAVGSLHGGLL